MSSSFTTYYDTLGVTPLASIEEVRRGYRRMAIKTHPDKNPHISKDITAKMFLLVTQAFEFLSDPERKRDYDELIELSREQQQFEVTSVVTQMELVAYYPMERAENLLRRFLHAFGSEEGSPELRPEAAPELGWDECLEIVPARKGKMQALPCNPRHLPIARDPLPLKLTYYAHKEQVVIDGEEAKQPEPVKEEVIDHIRRLSIKTQKSFKNFLEQQAEEALRGRTKKKMYDWELDSDDDISEGHEEEEVKCDDDLITVGGQPRKSHPQ